MLLQFINFPFDSLSFLSTAVSCLHTRLISFFWGGVLISFRELILKLQKKYIWTLHKKISERYQERQVSTHLLGASLELHREGTGPSLQSKAQAALLWQVVMLSGENSRSAGSLSLHSDARPNCGICSLLQLVLKQSFLKT